MVAGPENLLEEDIYNGEMGHAAKHNAANDQINWLTVEHVANMQLVGKNAPGFRGQKVYLPYPSGDHATDQAALDDLIDLMGGLGGGAVVATPAPADDPYLWWNVVTPANVQIIGAGETATYVQAPDTAGVGHVIASANFTALKGSNTWLTSADVPYAFGVSHMTIDGNKAGRGLEGGTAAEDITNAAVAFYGKNLLCDGLRIINSPGDGWYSECANGGGQTDETDLPEGWVGRINARSNDGVGVHVRGPHDGRWGDIITLANGREGWLVEGDSATYNGTSDVTFVHSYSNGQRYADLGRDDVPGVRFTGTGAGVRVAMLISESNLGPAIINNAGNTMISELFAYNNYAHYDAEVEDPSSVHVQLAFQDAWVGHLRCDVNDGGSAVKIAGAGVQVGTMTLRGYTSDGIGLDLDADNIRCPSVQISGFSGSGGHAVRINATGGRGGSVVNGNAYDCANGLTAGINSGSGNMYLGLDHDIRLAVTGTSGAQTAHNLDANFLSSRPTTSSLSILPRGSTPTTGKVLFDTRELMAVTNLNFGSIAAGATASLTLTVTGAQVGDTVSVGPREWVEAGLMWCAYVSAADTVTIRVLNTTAAPIDPANTAWRAIVRR